MSLHYKAGKKTMESQLARQGYNIVAGSAIMKATGNKALISNGLYVG